MYVFRCFFRMLQSRVMISIGCNHVDVNTIPCTRLMRCLMTVMSTCFHREHIGKKTLRGIRR